jgi:hypothetical protein
MAQAKGCGYIKRGQPGAAVRHRPEACATDAEWRSEKKK